MMDRNIDLVSLPKKSFWKLSAPMVAFCVFDAIYGIIDMLWVSSISVDAFFAMGISVPIVTLIFSFGVSIGMGTNSIMSRFIGSGNYDNAYNSLIHGILFSVVLWIFILLSIFFIDNVLHFMDVTKDFDLIYQYLVSIMMFSFVFIYVSLFSETLQAEGNSRTPTILVISSNILNIVLDPIFIFYLNLGIAGAAYATILSSLVSLVIILYLYLSGRTKVPLSFRYFKFQKYIGIEIFKVALPNFFDCSLWCIAAIFINQALLLTMGAIGTILYSASNKIRMVLESPMRGFSRGLMSVTGHLFGARQFDDLREMYSYALKVTLSVSFIVAIIFILIRENVYLLFSLGGMESSVFWIAVCGFVIVMSVPFSVISSKMLDGFGKSPYSLLFTLLKIIVQITLIYSLDFLFSRGGSVLAGIMLSEVIFALVYYVFLKYIFKTMDERYENRETVKSVI